MKNSKRKYILFTSTLLLLLWYFFALPKDLFPDPLSNVVLSSEGELLGAQIAKDGQWRFPSSGSVSEKFEAAILTFEDKRFHSHWGIDPIAIFRAIKQNIVAGKVVSGGSTITMQTVRLSRKGKPRTLVQKIIEAWMALRLELAYSKSEILDFYSTHAPFGGNVVGLQTASWRYYGITPEQLSWGQAACLAVLPNSPALIHPGRNRTALVNKRNRLLDLLQSENIIDAETCTLAKLESIPEAPLPLPRLAPHLLDRINQHKESESLVRSSIRVEVQKNLINIANNHQLHLAGNSINNLAILVLDLEKNEVIGYLGNMPGTGKENQADVDIIQARRSTGSILKPLLYGLSMEDGMILPNSFLTDIPTSINGYRPENFYNAYDGVVPANKAVSRSLNIPFVRLLQEYQIERFWKQLGTLGVSSIQSHSPEHYGLTIILGGAEASLWELTNTYGRLARQLNYFNGNSSQYLPNNLRRSALFFPNNINKKQEEIFIGEQDPHVLSAGSTWSTFQAMKQLERPNEEGEWEYFKSSGTIAWKTGTSIGFRDAWAIGVNSKYAIGVWVGNADGEGRPGLIGARAAAPILFDAFRMFPSAAWFDQPYDDMEFISTCSTSGNRAGIHCQQDSTWVPRSSLKVKKCDNHELIYTNSERTERLHHGCKGIEELTPSVQFNLDPIQAHYYALRHPEYKIVPPWRSECAEQLEGDPIRMIYPLANTTIKLPVDLTGKTKSAIFEAAHTNRSKKIHWQVDQKFIGTTEDFHSMEISVPIGDHQLTLTDEDGYQLKQRFTRIL